MVYVGVDNGFVYVGFIVVDLGCVDCVVVEF